MRGNRPFTSKRVQELPRGFNSSGIFPNRKRRRLILQKQTHNPTFGKMITRVQPEIDKNTGRIKFIYHFPHYHQDK